jgi:nucleoid-associated protein YgaU
MKLKEAQMLGILALIAVGIILLCMWGGEESVDPASAQAGEATPGEEAALDTDLAELWNELVPDQGPGLTPAPPVEEACEVQFVPPPVPEPVVVSEETVIRDLIEEVAPAELPLTPPEPAADEGGQTVPPRQFTRPKIHVVSSGETLSGISKKYYGTTTKWKKILEANKGVLSDPKQLRIDMKLKIPVESTDATAELRARDASENAGSVLLTASSARSGRKHTAVKGDTLYRIALKYYGNGMRYKDILSANRGVLKDPKDLKPGMEVVVP